MKVDRHGQSLFFLILFLICVHLVPGVYVGSNPFSCLQVNKQTSGPIQQNKYLLTSVYFLGTIYGCVLQSIVYTNMPLNPLSLIVTPPKLTNES